MPRGRLLAPLIGGMLLCLLVTLGWEGWWRSQGLVAGVADDDALWSRNRLAAADGDPDKLVIVGSSRALYGLVPEVIAEVTGREAIQLSITNSHPWKVVDHLANDPDFRGMVLVDVAPENFAAAAGHRDSKYDHVKTRLAHCEKASVSPSEQIEGRLSTRLASQLVLRQPGVSPIHLEALRVGAGPGAPQQSPYILRWDRQAWLNPDMDKKHWADAGAATVKGFAAWSGWLQRGHYPKKKQYDALQRRFLRSIKRLRAKGGDLVMVAVPMGARLGVLQDKAFPRQRYWDAWVARAEVIGINYEDYDQLSRYVPVDESHLSQADARAFSRALAEILVDRLAGAVGPPAAATETAAQPAAFRPVEETRALTVSNSAGP